MESLESLKERLREAERDLEKITIKKSSTTPWAPGVQDQYESFSFDYYQYKDPSQAAFLKSQIDDLKRKIDSYAFYAKQERDSETAYIDAMVPKYEYTHAGETKTTTNQAIAARYDAQHRFYGMTKFGQTVAKITGKHKKFKKLWNKATIAEDEATQQHVAEELNKLFK